MANLMQPNPDVARSLGILRRQIDEAQSSLSIHLTLHSTVRKLGIVRLSGELARPFHAISNASLNNAIVMAHQIFDGSKPAYSLRIAKGDPKIAKSQTDTVRLRNIFKDHKEAIEKIRKFRNHVAAHSLPDISATSIVDDIKLDIWAVKCLLKAAAEVVDGLFSANPILGLPFPDFDHSNDKLEEMLGIVFSKGFRT